MRRLARRLWVPAVLAAAAAAAQEPPAGAATPPAAPVRIEQVTFIPPRFTVGDPVELQVVLAGLPAGFEGRAARPAATPAAPLAPIVIDGIAPVAPVAGGRHLLRVSFRSFQPGSAALPAVDLGGGVLVELPDARTDATLPDGVGRLEPAPGPLPLPGTASRLAAVAAVLLACPAAAVFGARRAARVLGRLLAGGRRRPRLRFERDLRALRGRGPAGAAYSAEVARLTRRFLAARLQVRARSKTSAELPALLAGAGLTRHAAAAVTHAIAATERFTFGGAPLGDRDAAALAAQAREAVAAAERELEEGATTPAVPVT